MNYPDLPRLIRGAGLTALASLLLLGIARADDTKEKPLMKNFMGLNGHATFKPSLYQPIASQVRNYHPMWWDTDGDPSVVPKFPVGLDKITGPDPIDWSKLFGGWKEKGFAIDDSIQFEFLPAATWKDMEKEAFNYGQAYAKCLGPSNGNYVSSVEIGNEPSRGHWPAETYKKVFENMAKGFKDGDPKLKVATAWATANKTDKSAVDVSNLADIQDVWDIINIHTYSMITGWPTWRRVHPEHSDIDYLKVVNELIDWRNANAKDKEIWITEFGYDAKSDHAPAAQKEFTKWVSSTETEQAQWLVRSFLIFSGMDVDRAYLYYYNDNDEAIFHGSSGITRKFEPKPAYYAVAHLQKTLGDYRFSKAIVKDDESVENEIKEDAPYDSVEQNRKKKEAPKKDSSSSDDAAAALDTPKGDGSGMGLYVYEYVNPDKPSEPIWVAWFPSGSQHEGTVKIPVTGKVTKAERMPLKEGDADPVDFKDAGGNVELSLSESPTYIFLQK